MNSRKTIGSISLIFAALLMGAALLTLAAMKAVAQSFPIAGTASGFSSAQYFEPPHQQQVKSKISGAEAQEITGQLWLIKQVKIEKFDMDGKLQITANAPQCFFDRITAVANSPGELHIRSGDGQVKIDSIGFLWRQRDSLLTISNQVTVLTPHQ